MRGSRPASSAVFLPESDRGWRGCLITCQQHVHSPASRQTAWGEKEEKERTGGRGPGEKITFSKLWCANGGTCIGLESFGGKWLCGPNITGRVD